MKRTITFGQLKKLVKESSDDRSYDRQAHAFFLKTDDLGDKYAVIVDSVFEDGDYEMDDLAEFFAAQSHGTCSMDMEDVSGEEIRQMLPPNIAEQYPLYPTGQYDYYMVTVIANRRQPSQRQIVRWLEATFDPTDVIEQRDEDEKTQETYAVSKDGAAVFAKEVAQQGVIHDWFCHNKKLRTVVIPDGVKEIGVLAFYDCPNLVSVTIPDSVEFIDEKAFWKCPKLTRAEIPADAEVDGAFDKNTKVVRRGEGVNENTKVTLTFAQLKKLIKA